MVKRILKVIICAILAIALIFTALLAFLTIRDYRPGIETPLQVKNNAGKVLKTGTEFSIVTFNIGYCGLDKNQDFFLDGGTMSRSSSKAQTMANLEKITEFLAAQNTDAILLQELDTKSTRSFYVNEKEYMETTFKDYGSFFGQNYKVPWVPIPPMQPMGMANSGLVTFSRYNVSEAARYQYPGSEAWPVQLFELDRCFVESRIPVEGGKELVLINSHLSAFDKGGEIRKKQLDFLKAHITGEYSKGNYVITGGDWNHQLPGTDSSLFGTTESWPFWLQKLPEDFTPSNFTWGVDKTVPSNRTVAKAYQKGQNFLSVIDGYLVSPNVGIISVKGHDLGFENSDHNPVTGVFVLH
jgi:endonuclease/exonuclease/phosphatase family metal-dependent hydrolase